MTQHFLLSSAARTLSLVSVARLSEDEARATFQAIRWADNNGKPYCQRCGCADAYHLASRHLWKCKGCAHQYSVTSGTIFSSRKMEIRNILLAIAIFMNGAKGHSALQLSRDLDCQYKTAFVLAHKIREALASEDQTGMVGGEGSEVEVDGAFFGGYIKPSNYKENRRDRRLTKNQNGKRRCVVIMRERNGRTLPFVFKAEGLGVAAVQQHVVPGTIIHADEASHWDVLHAQFPTLRINHSEAYSHDGACTNQAESFFSRLRRAEIGTHHHISGQYLAAYAGEMAWRENNRRISNGDQYLIATNAALVHPKSLTWAGYWQRHKEAA